MEWYTSTKQTPAEVGEYLVYCNGDYIEVDYWDGLDWDMNYDGHFTVTHWAYLPPEPKGVVKSDF